MKELFSLLKKKSTNESSKNHDDENNNCSMASGEISNSSSCSIPRIKKIKEELKEKREDEDGSVENEQEVGVEGEDNQNDHDKIDVSDNQDQQESAYFSRKSDLRPPRIKKESSTVRDEDATNESHKESSNDANMTLELSSNSNQQPIISRAANEDGHDENEKNGDDNDQNTQSFSGEQNSLNNSSSKSQPCIKDEPLNEEIDRLKEDDDQIESSTANAETLNTLPSDRETRNTCAPVADGHGHGGDDDNSDDDSDDMNKNFNNNGDGIDKEYNPNKSQRDQRSKDGDPDGESNDNNKNDHNNVQSPIEESRLILGMDEIIITGALTSLKVIHNESTEIEIPLNKRGQEQESKRFICETEDGDEIQYERCHGVTPERVSNY